MEIDIKQTLSPKEKLNKLKIPEDMQLWGVRQIRFSDLDFNGHMSNSIYGNIIEDYLPYNYINNSNLIRKELYKLQINYVKESKLKDSMSVYGKELEQGFIMTGSVEGCHTFGGMSRRISFIKDKVYQKNSRQSYLFMPS